MKENVDIEKANSKALHKIEIPDEIKTVSYNRDSIKNNQAIIDQVSVRKDIPDFEEKQNLKQIDDEFQNMHLDVGNEFLVNESDYNGDIDLSNKLMTDKLKFEVESFHPRKIEVDGSLSKIPVCSSDTGCFGFKMRNDLEILGLGTVIYFKVLKTYLILFLIIFIINIPLIYVYVNSKIDKPVLDYSDALFRTTLGNIGSFYYNCQKIKFTDVIKYSYYTLNLECQNNNISSITHFGHPENYEKSLDNDKYCYSYSTQAKLSISTNCTFSEMLNTKYEECNGKSRCEIKLDTSEISRNCLIQSINQEAFLYFAYSCFSPDILVNSFKFDRSIFAFYVVGTDIISIIILIIGVLIIGISQKSNEEYFKKEKIEICDYTVRFKDIAFDGKNLNSDLGDLYQHVLNIIRIETGQNLGGVLIYDINYPIFSTNILDLYIQKNKAHTKRRKFMKLEEEALKENTDSVKINKYQNKVKEINSIIDKIGIQLRKTKDRDLDKIDDIYFTFVSRNLSKLISDKLRRGKCSRCCLIFCCQKKKISHLYFNNKWLNIDPSPDEPSNIRWEYMTYSEVKRFFRRIFAIISALIVILASFGIVIAAKYAENAINKDLTQDIECKYVKYSEETVIEEFTSTIIPDKKKFKLYCYCLDMLITKPTEISTLKLTSKTGQKLEPCKTWLTLYLQSKSLKIGIIVLIPVINIFLSSIMDFLTEFEKNKYLSQNMASKMWKSFILQAINTGIILLIVNINIESVKQWNSEFPIFTGEYNDIDPKWYSYVGTTIIFYMILNIITPHISLILCNCVYLPCKRCYDRRGGLLTRLKSKKDFLKLYVGPDFDMGTRYSQILSTIFVILLYSPGIPILYLLIFLFFLITYYVDKYLVLNIYRKPPHIDLYVSKVFNYLIFLAIILHLSFSIWMYGNKYILVDSSSTFMDKLVDIFKEYLNIYVDNEFKNEVVMKLTLPHNIILLAFLVFLIICFILKITLYNFLRALFCSCSSKKVEDKDDSNLNLYQALPFRALYLTYQMRKAQYMNFKNSKISNSILKSYYENNIRMDRYYISKRIFDYSGKDFNNIHGSVFDLEVIPEMQRNLHFREVEIKILGDVSYNIVFVPEFKDVMYYEYISPFLRKENHNQ